MSPFSKPEKTRKNGLVSDRNWVGIRQVKWPRKSANKLQLGQRQAACLFGWGRDTLRKACHEIRTGLTCADAFCLRGRKPIEFHLPHLFDDLRGLVQDHLQTDPTFQTTGLYCRLSAPEVRKQLIERVGYTDEQLPSVQTIASKLNVLGFRLRTVVKSRPQKN